MGLRMKKFSTMGGSLKNPIFIVGVGEGEGPKKSIYRGWNDLKEGCGQFPDLRGEGDLATFLL